MVAHTPHIPVMTAEVLRLLSHHRQGETLTLLDGTFGNGGHSRALLAEGHTVVALDQDPAAQSYVQPHKALTFQCENFAHMERILHRHHIPCVDGIVLDLGVSSGQLDAPDRGFSFRTDGPLDMRMAQSGVSAAEIVNAWDADQLADLIRTWGEEPRARRIAQAIVRQRPIHSTLQLAEVVASVVPQRGGKNPATRTFQALRIAVNDEMVALEGGLGAGQRLLAPAGRMVVISFHSLEDRMVKHTFRRWAEGGGHPNRHAPPSPQAQPDFRVLTPRGLKPTDEEVFANPRARSAVLRAVERKAAAHKSASSAVIGGNPVGGIP